MVLVLVAGLLGIRAFRKFHAPGTAEAQTLLIPKGTGLAGVSRILGTAGLAAHPGLFTIAVRAAGRGRDLKAGEYAIPAGASMSDIMNILTAGKVILHRVTVPEGLTVAQAVALLAATAGLEGGLRVMPGEGRLLPETYSFERGIPVAEMVARMSAAMTAALTESWAGRASGLSLSSPDEALALASMIEKETGLPEERARISAVFHNRLKKRMRLQSDPTVVFALTQGAGPLDRPLRKRDLKIDSPYNTYLHYGLPPGPIALPGRASLEAALHPLETDELYFVADGGGGHAFAKTLRGHDRNVRRWRRLERRNRD